jgi:hypothetical protein
MRRRIRPDRRCVKWLSVSSTVKMGFISRGNRQALATYAFDSAVNPTSAVVLDVADMAAEVIAEKPFENAANLIALLVQNVY